MGHAHASTARRTAMYDHYPGWRRHRLPGRGSRAGPADPPGARRRAPGRHVVRARDRAPAGSAYADRFDRELAPAGAEPARRRRTGAGAATGSTPSAAARAAVAAPRPSTPLDRRRLRPPDRDADAASAQPARGRPPSCSTRSPPRWFDTETGHRLPAGAARGCGPTSPTTVLGARDRGTPGRRHLLGGRQGQRQLPRRRATCG